MPVRISAFAQAPVKPPKEIGVNQRGWTLDVLNVVRRISEGRDGALRRPRSSQRDDPTNTFTTLDVYAFTRELEKLHPDNSENIREQAVTFGIKPVSNFKSYVMPDCYCTSSTASGVCRER